MKYLAPCFLLLCIACTQKAGEAPHAQTQIDTAETRSWNLTKLTEASPRGIEHEKEWSKEAMERKEEEIKRQQALEDHRLRALSIKQLEQRKG